MARSLDGSDVASMPPCTRELWHYLLRKVNYADNGKFKRGQGFFTLEQIQSDLSWWVGYRRSTYSKPELTKAMRRLREAHMIESTKEIRGMLVTVCKYDHYQDPANYEGNGVGNAKEIALTTGVITISKEEKKKKKEEGKERAKGELQWPSFAGPNVKAKWREFVLYRISEKKSRYKSVATEQRALNLAAAYFPSGRMFVEALDHAMAKTWSFPVDPTEYKYPFSADAKPQPVSTIKPWIA